MTMTLGRFSGQGPRCLGIMKRCWLKDLVFASGNLSKESITTI